jgi:hypothetical protein
MGAVGVMVCQKVRSRNLLLAAEGLLHIYLVLPSFSLGVSKPSSPRLGITSMGEKWIQKSHYSNGFEADTHAMTPAEEGFARDSALMSSLS